MKKIFFSAVAAVALSAFIPSAASAQVSLGNILNTVKEVAGSTSSSSSSSSSKSSTASSLLSGLSSIFSSSKVATAEQIVGTWTYQEPAIVFESSNVLKSAGGKVVSSAMEKKLQTQLTKYGIKKGQMKMTFDKDGNFTQTIGKKTVSGTYTLDGKNVKLEYAGKVSQIVGTTQLDGSSLLIVMDASKLLKFVSAASKLTSNSTLKTASSLLGSMDGMQCGLRLKK